MFRAWHAHNGVSLGEPEARVRHNPGRPSGRPVPRGLLQDLRRDLEPDERLQFSPTERGPAFDPLIAPRLPVEEWTEVRAARALRNYAVEYVTSHVNALMEMYGISGARPIVEHASRVIYAQLSRKVIDDYNLGDVDPGPEALACSSNGTANRSTKKSRLRS